jgi:hypothetical protein
MTALMQVVPAGRVGVVPGPPVVYESVFANVCDALHGVVVDEPDADGICGRQI